MTTPIFDQAHPKIIEITFCFPEFAPPCKKSVHSINSFLRYSQFSQIWDLCRNIANNIHFSYRTNSVKINDKIFQYIKKKTCFCSIFLIFGAQKLCRKSGSVTHNFIWVSSIIPKFIKN